MTARVLCLAAAFSSFIGSAAYAEDHLQLVERAATDKTVDFPPKGDSVGDLIVFRNPVYTADNSTQVGTDQGYCIRVAVRTSWECFWTLVLKDGQITVEGPDLDNSDSVLVVTGGTGKYAGAKGSMLLHARDKKGTAYDLTYDLL